MTNSLQVIKDAYQAQNYAQALKLIEWTEQQGEVCSDLLVWKARCIQLVDDEKYELSDVETILNQALAINETSTPAILELAWYYFNVLDDARKAGSLFDRAITLIRSEMLEALVGRARCEAQIVNVDTAKQYLESMFRDLPDSEEMRRLREDLSG